MIESLSSKHLLAALEKMAEDLPGEAEHLRELDAAIGDGDLGVTITIGFEAVAKGLADLQDADPSTILLKSGMTFNRHAASTFGALFATMMMGAAKAVKGVDELGTAEVAAMATAAVEGVQKRGKASAGDKTMLDALIPAADVLGCAAAEEASLSDALQQAVGAAEQGVASTIEMKSKVGRGSWFADRTVGVADPGATAVTLMIKSLAEYVAG
jgi:dihydroxyacetone kinase-like protein